jgi:hypothetical protein
MLSAFNGIFTRSQLQDIQSMSRIAHKSGVALHDILDIYPPTYKTQVLRSTDYKKKISKDNSKNRSAAHIEMPCIVIECNGTMELYSVCCADREMKKQGYFTKWECNKCGKVEYSKQTLNDAKNFYGG